VHIVVGLYPGSGSDIIARLMGQSLSELLGLPFVIDNKPGASGNIATEMVVRAQPDGYTLLMAGGFNTINATLHEKLNFDFIRDIAPVASIDRVALVIVVNPTVPAKTVPEFISYAKTNPGKINMGSGGIGNVSHVAGELFKMATGIDMVHVPYRGSPLPDLLGGQVQVVFSPIPASIGYIRTGKLRALAVTTATRSEALPDIPIVSEFVPGYEAILWDGIGSPSNTPPEIIAILNKQVNAALADPMFKRRLVDLGMEPFANTPAEFGKFLAVDVEKWTKVIKFAGIKPE
jgi:tripartite-type tricarboxylate transporter receptor subunit TctC